MPTDCDIFSHEKYLKGKNISITECSTKEKMVKLKDAKEQ